MIYAIGRTLERWGLWLQAHAYPMCAHVTGISRPAFWCADCGEMRSNPEEARPRE